MKNNTKVLYFIVWVLFTIIFMLSIPVFWFFGRFGMMHNYESINNIQEENTNKSIQNIWKNTIERENEVSNYKYATNLEFWSWNIVDINLEAMEKELELIPWVKTKIDTYNPDSIEPLIIRVKQGDKLNIHFKNSLSQSTTVHWHWVRVPNSQDWVPWITQETVKSWDKYEYSFVTNDPWTFIFHPHDNHSEQIGRGLYGILIVEWKDEPKYNKDITWVLKDYRVWQDWKLTNDFPNFHDSVHWWRLGNVVTVNNIVNYSENINPWDTIRLRLANISNARIYNLDLSWLDAKIIATDDSLVNKPTNISHLEISPWERYQLEIKFWDDKKNIEVYDKYFTWYNPVKIATLNVGWEQNTNLTSIETPIWDLPDWRDISYTKPDVVIDLWWMWVMWWDKGMMMWMWWQRWWTINDGIFPDSNTAIKLKEWQQYVIRMVNNSKRDHPMHLHWDFFQVVSVNWMKWEYVWFKDTVNVKPLSYIDVVMIPTNEWTWAFHCHILEHADLGMFTTVIVE